MSEETKKEKEEEKKKETVIEPAVAGVRIGTPPLAKAEKGLLEQIEEDISGAIPGIITNLVEVAAIIGSFVALLTPLALASHQFFTMRTSMPFWMFYLLLGIGSVAANAIMIRTFQWAGLPIARTSYVYRTIAGIILPFLSFIVYLWRDAKRYLVYSQMAAGSWRGTTGGAELRAPPRPAMRTGPHSADAAGDAAQLEGIMREAPKVEVEGAADADEVGN